MLAIISGGGISGIPMMALSIIDPIPMPNCAGWGTDDVLIIGFPFLVAMTTRSDWSITNKCAAKVRIVIFWE